MKPYFNVRAAYPNDAMQLLDIDIKCFDNAWTPEEWDEKLRGVGHGTCIITNFGVPIAFAVFALREDWDAIEIVKIAVKPGFRRQGLSARLLAEAFKVAEGRRFGLVVVVPESTIDPSAESSLLPWLTAVGFKGTAPFLRKHFVIYGEVEDGVKFVMTRSQSRITA